jgi:hypothetical protein
VMMFQIVNHSDIGVAVMCVDGAGHDFYIA